MDKKVWVNPELNVFGDVKELTQQVTISKIGSVGDTIIINGIPIGIPGSQIVITPGP